MDAPQSKQAAAIGTHWMFDVNKHIEPKFVLNVMKKQPELFSDLQPIPADVAIGPGYVFKSQCKQIGRAHV